LGGDKLGQKEIAKKKKRKVTHAIDWLTNKEKGSGKSDHEKGSKLSTGKENRNRSRLLHPVKRGRKGLHA